jgi:hypothetical protein
MTPSAFSLRPVIGILADRIKVLANPGDHNPNNPPTTVDLGLYVTTDGQVLALTAEQVRERTIPKVPTSQSPINQPLNQLGPTGPTGYPSSDQLAFRLSDYQQGEN